MRKLVNLLIVLTIISTVFSCGKDDDTTPTPDATSNNALVGTWKMAEMDYTADATTTLGSESVTSFTVATGANYTYEIEFTANTYSTSGGYDIDLVTTTFGTDINQTVVIADVEGTGEYTIDETESTITTTSGSLVSFEANGASNSESTSSEPANYTIDSNGDLIFEDVSTSTSSQQGATTTQVVDYRMRFVKQ